MNQLLTWNQPHQILYTCIQQGKFTLRHLSTCKWINSSPETSPTKYIDRTSLHWGIYQPSSASPPHLKPAPPPPPPPTKNILQGKFTRRYLPTIKWIPWNQPRTCSTFFFFFFFFFCRASLQLGIIYQTSSAPTPHLKPAPQVCTHTRRRCRSTTAKASHGWCAAIARWTLRGGPVGGRGTPCGLLVASRSSELSRWPLLLSISWLLSVLRLAVLRLAVHLLGLAVLLLGLTVLLLGLTILRLTVLRLAVLWLVLLRRRLAISTLHNEHGKGGVKVDVLLYIHGNCRFIRDGSPGCPPQLSHSSWALWCEGRTKQVSLCQPWGRATLSEGRATLSEGRATLSEGRATLSELQQKVVLDLEVIFWVWWGVYFQIPWRYEELDFKEGGLMKALLTWWQLAL